MLRGAKLIAPPAARPDLPQGHPQRLNPADYDVGFHRDGRPWRLSCLTYCDRLLRLARACGLLAVLTTDAHYARPADRALHLVCRAAGHDQPLSGYPEPVPGARCLRPRAELEEELAAAAWLRMSLRSTTESVMQFLEYAQRHCV